MARDLINEPPDLVTPAFLAQSAQALATAYGFSCEVWDEARIASERMNCLRMVGRGATNPRASSAWTTRHSKSLQSVSADRQGVVLRQRRTIAEAG